jgi:hypothetical protein
MKKRLEVTQVENGYKIQVYVPEDDSAEELMYTEPKEYIAEDDDELKRIIDENFIKVKSS